MSQRPVPQPGILSIAPYVPGKSGSDASKTVAKLSANESPLGASPLAVAALGQLSAHLAEYPEGSSFVLRDALAKKHAIVGDRIVVGSGSDELLHLIAQTFLGEGDEAIVTQYGFLVYPIVTKGAGATPVVAADKDYVADVDAILAAVTDKTKVVFLANPNNPTGTFISGDEMRRLHQGLRADILLVIDNAYAEYVTARAFEDGKALAGGSENVVMVRTFSKIGLAAVRLGWLYGPAHIVDALNRLRGPFNVNIAAQLAGVAALEDDEFTAKLAAHNAHWRTWLSAELQSNQVRILPSEGNFILALFNPDSGVTAAAANQALLANGIIVREMGGYGLPNALRISIGDEAAMRAVATILNGLSDHG